MLSIAPSPCQSNYSLKGGFTKVGNPNAKKLDSKSLQPHISSCISLTITGRHDGYNLLHNEYDIHILGSWFFHPIRIIYNPPLLQLAL